MGTRSTYRVIEEWTDDRPEAKVKKGQNKLILMYAQFDGYPDGLQWRPPNGYRVEK
jgi:hypothetical protein